MMHVLCDFAVPVVHEQAALVVTSLQTTSISRHFPASVLCREQRDDFRPSLHHMEDKTLLVTFLLYMTSLSSIKEKKKRKGGVVDI